MRILRKPSISELKDTLLDETFNVEPIDNSKNVLRRLFFVLLLAAIFMGIEIAGGIISHSIAILSDAAHMLSDLLGFVISILSVYISGLPASKKHSYGYHRAGVIGALASVVIIWALMIFLISYAVERIINIDQVEVEGKLMFGVACFGLLTNLVMIKVLHSDGKHNHGHEIGHSHEDTGKHIHVDEPFPRENQEDERYEYALRLDADSEEQSYDEKSRKLENESLGTLPETANISEENPATNKRSKKHHHLSKSSISENLNVRASIIHILGDILQSIGVIVASALIWVNPDWKIADPIATLIFALIIMYTTFRITRDCIFVLMEGTPLDFDLDEFEQKIKEIEGVRELHDLHVWALGVDKPAMSAHIFTDNNEGAVLKNITRICRLYGIYHSTIQIETIEDREHQDYFECKHNLH